MNAFLKYLKDIEGNVDDMKAPDLLWCLADTYEIYLTDGLIAELKAIKKIPEMEGK